MCVDWRQQRELTHAGLGAQMLSITQREEQGELAFTMTFQVLF